MATITLSISNELKERMDKLPNVRWSSILRGILIRKVKQLKEFEKITARGEL
ncbi:MAG: hypothetical protein AABW56_02565 [Nanoarchaeota archaeon]